MIKTIKSSKEKLSPDVNTQSESYESYRCLPSVNQSKEAVAKGLEVTDFIAGRSECVVCGRLKRVYTESTLLDCKPRDKECTDYTNKTRVVLETQ